MEISILRDVRMLCPGKEPSTGAKDSRFLIPGDRTFPTVRAWPGFKSTRSVTVGGRLFQVVCAVREGCEGPLFTCQVLLDEAPGNCNDHVPRSIQSVGLSTTTVVRAIFEQLARIASGNSEGNEEYSNIVGRVHVKGLRFFGFRAAPIAASLLVHQKENTPPQEEDQPTTTSTCNCLNDDIAVAEIDNVVEVFAKERSSRMLELSNVRWCGVAAPGSEKFSDCKGWTITFGDDRLTLRPGFTALREVCTEEGKWVTVTCKIVPRPEEEGTNAGPPLPFYECSASREGISVGSFSCTSSVRQLLQRLKAKTRHHWSGNFFGFNVSSVRKLLSAASVDESRPKRTRLQPELAPILVRVQTTVQHGNGPTSSLKKKESREKRNEMVNAVASYASFGDVKSKYNSYWLFLLF